jgi:hypothetical protein
MTKENARIVWWIGGLVLAVCIAMSRNLMTIWQIDPFVKSGGFAFVIWSAGVILPAWQARTSPSWQWVMGAAVLHFAAAATGLEVIRHASLATAAAAFVPTSRGRIMILIASAGWMPALGWFGHRLFAENLDPVRIPLTLALVCLAQPRVAIPFQWNLLPKNRIPVS